MSKFFSSKYRDLVPYTPGEQPQEQVFIKLNTNESPFPASPKVQDAVSEAVKSLHLYSDPESAALSSAVADYLNVSRDQILMTNGSDEILNFAFMAFGDSEHPFSFPDITYGFYKVIADLNQVPFREIPLKEDFTVDVEAFCRCDSNIVIPNPNAPTGIPLAQEDIRRIVESNKDHLVIIDEAYVDFGGISCIPLTGEYDNLLVTQTFSKSRSLAGGRLGFGVGNSALIRDLNTLKYSCNPYNVNRLTSAAGIAAIDDEEYFRRNINSVITVREQVSKALVQRGFSVLPSCANFLFVNSNFCSSETLYLRLREKGVLVRYWNSPRIENWCRITIGSADQMSRLIAAVDEIMEENKHETVGN